MEAPDFNNSQTILFALSSEIIDLFNGELEKIIGKCTARCALVVDRTGCVLASSGKFGEISPYVMGATAAATVAALNSMASGAGSSEVSVEFYDAQLDKIHFQLIDDRLILCILHNRSSTGGSIRAAAREFLATVHPALETERNIDGGDHEELLESVNYIESKLDELFKDSLFESND